MWSEVLRSHILSVMYQSNRHEFFLFYVYMHIFSVYSVHFLLSCNPSTLNSPFCEIICNFMKISKPRMTSEFSRQGHKVFMAMGNYQRVRFTTFCSIWCCCAVQVTVYSSMPSEPQQKLNGISWNYEFMNISKVWRLQGYCV